MMERSKIESGPTNDEFEGIRLALADINFMNFLQLAGGHVELLLPTSSRGQRLVELHTDANLSRDERLQRSDEALTANLDRKMGMLSEASQKHQAVCQSFFMAPRVVGGDVILKEGDSMGSLNMKTLAKNMNLPEELASLLAEKMRPEIAQINAPEKCIGVEPMIAIDICEVSAWEDLIARLAAQPPGDTGRESFLLKAAECFLQQLHILAKLQGSAVEGAGALDSHLGCLSTLRRTTEILRGATIADPETKMVFDDCRAQLEFLSSALTGQYFDAALRLLNCEMLDRTRFLDETRIRLKLFHGENLAVPGLTRASTQCEEYLREAADAYEQIPGHLSQVRHQFAALLEEAMELCEAHRSADLTEDDREALALLVKDVRQRIS